jgi:hypothetical protein
MTITSFPSVDDLRRAVCAAGTDGTHTHAGPATPERWRPASGEQVVLVCGCGGSSGVTTLSLGLATLAGRARIVETCPGSVSGLAYAASAELGQVGHGWLRGARDAVLVERRPGVVGSPSHLPPPAASELPLTIVDSSWDVATVLASRGWLGDLTRSASTVVLVARATVPGLRRLEAAIDRVGEARVVAATIGAKRWPRPVEQSAGPAVRRMALRNRIVHVPDVSALGLSGLTPDPLPPAILRSARALLTLLEGPLS